PRWLLPRGKEVDRCGRSARRARLWPPALTRYNSLGNLHLTPQRAFELSTKHPTLTRRFFGVAPKLFAHRREELSGKIACSTRSETLIESSAQHRRRDTFIDGGFHRPAS